MRLKSFSSQRNRFRKLRLEPLEERQMLSVSSLGIEESLYGPEVVVSAQPEYSNDTLAAPFVMASQQTQLDAPVLSHYIDINATTIAVYYSAVANASGYTIQYATDANFTQNVGTVLPGASTTAASSPRW